MKKEFALSEHQALRTEIMFHWQQITRMQSYAVTITIAVYSWLLTRPESNALLILAWALPPVFTILGAERTRVLFKRMYSIGDYIESLEKVAYLDSEELGWERNKHSYFKTKPKDLGNEKIFWVALFVINLTTSTIAVIIKLA